MKKTYAIIAVVSFIFGLAAGIIFALVKISRKDWSQGSKNA